LSVGAAAASAGGDDADASEEEDSTVEPMATVAKVLLVVGCDGGVKAMAPVMAHRRVQTVVVLMVEFGRDGIGDDWGIYFVLFRRVFYSATGLTVDRVLVVLTTTIARPIVAS